MNFTQISLLLVLICWTTCSTGFAISFEEEFLQLKENYIQMKEIVKNLESKVIELESKDVQMKEKVTELEAKVQQQDSLLTSLLPREKTNSADLAPINQSAVAVNGLPSSCGDLKMIGHTLNGFYSIMGTTMMESVYCDFTKPPSDAAFQKWIGYADVKSMPVHFYVQRNSSFNTIGTPIPFSLALVNEGNAMNLQTGKFTAPRTGIYFFSFTGHVDFPASSSANIGIDLYLNGNLFGASLVSETNTGTYQFSQLTLQWTLNLKSGDQVWVMIDAISSEVLLYDNAVHFTHFSGFMLQEEIVASVI